MSDTQHAPDSDAVVGPQAALTEASPPGVVEAMELYEAAMRHYTAAAAGTYKGGVGFHPLMACLDATGECLAGVGRSGNAGSNTATDHFVFGVHVLVRGVVRSTPLFTDPKGCYSCPSKVSLLRRAHNEGRVS